MDNETDNIDTDLRYWSRNKEIICFLGLYIAETYQLYLWVWLTVCYMQGNLLLHKLKWDQNKCPLYGVAGCPLFRGF